MEEIIFGRLKLAIKQLNDLSVKAASYDTLTKEDLSQAEIVAAKMESMINRFNADLNNYFRLVNDPKADEISEMSSIQIIAEENLAELKVKLKQITSSSRDTVCRLPKLNLPEFSGEIIKWQQFWDQFQTNIHDRNIPDIDKFLYLKSSLTGDAKKLIEGLDTTNKNYKIAIDTLKERFGKPNFLIDAHYSALTNVATSVSSISSYRQTLNDLEKHLRVLEALGENVNHNHLRHLIISKFPEDLIYELKLKLKDDSITEIRNQLEKIITAREEANLLASSSSKNVSEKGDEKYTIKTLHIQGNEHKTKKRIFRGERNYGQRTNGGNQSFINRRYDQRQRKGGERKRVMNFHKYKKYEEGTSGKRRRLSCTFCMENHYPDQCTKYKTIIERKAQIKNTCFACLQKGHQFRYCRQKVKCKYCDGLNHNRALCPKKFDFDTKREVSNKSISTSNTLSSICKRGSTVLQTAVTIALKDDKTNKKCRILLDSGSQRSYVTTKIKRDLNLPVVKEERLSVFTFGAAMPKEFDSPVVKLQLVTRSGNKREIYANVVPTISQEIPSPPNNFSNWIDEKLLADDGTSKQVDILIGNDYYYNIMKEQKIQITDNLFLVDSEFGWIVSGKLEPIGTDEQTLSVITYFQTGLDMKLNSPDLPLNQGNMTCLWDLEAIGITDSPAANREEEALKTFNNTTKLIDNRYTVSWPWTEYPPSLSSNYGLAYGRLVNLLKRLDKDTLEDYNRTLQEQIDKGIIETVPDPNKKEDHPIHYLPHHCIRQKGKPIRIVYDASSKIKGNKSLNECLYCGPMMLEDLTGLLIQFRYHPVALSADVEKAFLQIGLHNKDRDVTRFLWIKDLTKPATKDNIVTMRFCRVPFGVISSPFLLNATIRHHLTNSDKPEVKDIASQIYVDNLITGTSSVNKALRLYKDTKETFQQISMNIREWSSNSKEFMKRVPDATQDNTVKILGLEWNLLEDTLKLRFNIETEAKTKRDVLKIIASVYDPCGFAVPQLLRAKLFLQGLWKMKLKWDTVLTKEILEEWTTIREELDNIKSIKVPRCYLQNVDTKGYQLHCFTDASSKAYAAVVYISHGNKVNFVIGKSRLVPIKNQQHLQIPRLELLGVLIGSRLINFVLKSLRVLHVDITLQIIWTDSQIVIEWLKTNKLLPPFVSRRVEEIKKNKNLIVRYVPTEVNPADIATRPMMSSKNDRDLWLLGPRFLSGKPESWPSDLTTTETSFLLTGEGLTNEVIRSEESLMKEGCCNAENVQSEISVKRQEETPINNRTEEIKKLQAQHFPREFDNEETDLSRNLKLFKDIDGILRCKGRFRNTDWSFDKRYPILIPKESDFTDKIIQKAHNDNYHVGVNHTLSIIRQTFWIPQGRSKIQKILRRCPECVKHGGGPFKLPPTPALPPERINYSEPFTYTGLDYLGPLLIKHQGGTEKRWVCLFTCLAVRAIHLEVVKDLTAEEGLLALRRMIASRGIPNMITSDNATQFKLMSEILAKPFCIENNIKWRFIPQLAPWFGGFYERLIGIVKTCMKRTLMKHLLNDTQLCTIVKEIESVVNSRPLTCVDSELEHILKPADFLTVGRCIRLETSRFEDQRVEGTATKIELVRAWKRALIIRDEFKDMFTNRYLLSLRERYNNSQREPRVKTKSLPQIGQVVQIKGDSKNRNEWKVGKITALPKGNDGNCRIAKVDVQGREFIRSIAHLYPLEIDNETDEYSYENQPKETYENLTEDVDLPDVHPDLTIPEFLPQHSSNQETLKGCVDQGERIQDNADGKGSERSELLEIDEKIERIDETQSTKVPKEKREAAKRAVQKIREWTRDLQCLFVNLPAGSVANYQQSANIL